MVRLLAIFHPVEIDFGKSGIGLIVFQTSGILKAFKNTGRRKQHLTINTVISTYRAGPKDIVFRVPTANLLSRKRILVVGIGAVGAPVAVELARNGCGSLHIIEYDKVEPGNTVRWPLGASAWGRSKLEALIDFLNLEYPATDVSPHDHFIGNESPTSDLGEDDDFLSSVLSHVDLAFDCSASHGVTSVLAERCRHINIPLISLSATPTLEGGVVVRHIRGGGCPICLEHFWNPKNKKTGNDFNYFEPPPGRGKEDGLAQPPGCAERTFIGAGFDLQELSLQAVRLAVETLSNEKKNESLIQTLSFVDENDVRCPPRWRVDALPKHPKCTCSP